MKIKEKKKTNWHNYIKPSIVASFYIVILWDSAVYIVSNDFLKSSDSIIILSDTAALFLQFNQLYSWRSLNVCV